MASRPTWRSYNMWRFSCFALAAVMSAALAFAVLSYEAVKTALANPVKSLKTE